MMGLITNYITPDQAKAGIGIFGTLFFIGIGVIIMKIKRGGRARADPRTVYKCSECGEYFSAPGVLKVHCEDVHNIILPESEDAECYQDTWEITPAKFQEMLDYEADSMTEQEGKEAERAYLLSAKLAADPKDDTEVLEEVEENPHPDGIFKQLMDKLETPATSKPLPGVFDIKIEGGEIRLMVAAKLPNTSANMAAISEFNAKIN